ncbi:BfmA/BtgA family mobilization protein [Parabacteroides goldsteinii]|uniref:BfmA/BtgA family mobilization protein n=1 Tax=Parabacteroides goldsteinii TaxID=328812 RepID=UPI00259B06A3|nr:BfmA/BtgA family mobilization protein [Parabacteroides goldsteinii]
MSKNTPVSYDYANIKVTKSTHKMLSDLAAKEGFSIKDTVEKMTSFFNVNNVSVTEKLNRFSDERLKEIDDRIKDGFNRVIKIYRSQERTYLENMLTNLNEITTFIKNDILLDSSEHKEPSLQEPINNEVHNIDERGVGSKALVYANKELVNMIKEILDVNTMLPKNIINGEKMYVKSFNETSIKEYIKHAEELYNV